MLDVISISPSIYLANAVQLSCLPRMVRKLEQRYLQPHQGSLIVSEFVVKATDWLARSKLNHILL